MMQQRLDMPWLPVVADMVMQRLGLHFPADRWGDLVRGVNAAARASGAKDTETFVCRLVEAAPGALLLQALTEALTVGETYFFREPQSFDVLADKVLPPLIAARRTGSRRLRFWSAGCCTGEEAYSLAILLDRMLPDLDDWQVTILATDVNQQFLRRAAHAEYGEWSFRDAPAWLKGRYFTRRRRGYALLPRIRRMVTFAPLNLAELQFPHERDDTAAMDVILCRNVMMYFPPALMRQVCQGFERALVDGGWLSVAATELGARAAASLVPVYFENAVFYRKTAEHRAPGSIGDTQVPGQPVADAVPVPTMPASRSSPITRPPVAPTAPLAREVGSADAQPATEEPRCLAILAREHADAGRLVPALEAIERALAHHKLDAGMHHLHATILIELGHVERARDALRRAVYLEPHFVIAHHALGQLALREGAQAAATRHFRNVLNLLGDTDADEVLPHSGGLVAGRLRALVDTAVRRRAGR